MDFSNLVKEYTKQTVSLFANNNPGLVNMQKDAYGTGVGQSNAVQLFYVTNGLFADCELEAPVINTTIQPQNGLANMIPVAMDNRDFHKYAYITGIDEGDNTLPDEACDFGPTPGDVSIANAVYEPGRYSTSSKTIEIDQLIRKAHRGVHEDFYLIGNVRGVSAIPTAQQLSDRDFVKRAAVRREMMLAGRKLQRSLLKAFWVGDPNDAAQNTAGGGRKAFTGLDLQITDQYGTAATPWVTGTNAANLNSDVRDWEGACVDELHPTDNIEIYDMLKSMEYTLWSRANHMGLLPTETVIVMRSELWYALLQVLPCQVLQGGCGNIQVNTDVPRQMDGNSGLIEVFRQRMGETMQLNLNGRNYSIVIDDFIPTTTTTNADGTFDSSSSIYFVPLRVANEPVLGWTLMDYRMIDQQLAPIPASHAQFLGGWSDGGRFHSMVSLGGNGRCFRVDIKIEPSLKLRAPMLAGVLQNVVACLNRQPALFDPSTVTV